MPNKCIGVFIFNTCIVCQHKCQKNTHLPFAWKEGQGELKPSCNAIKIKFNEMKECYKKIVFFLPSWAMFAKRFASHH